MKNFKTLNNAIILFVLMIAMGCHDDLELQRENVSPLSSLDPTSEDQALILANGVYAKFSKDVAGRWDLMGVLPIRGDDVSSGKTGDQTELYDIESFNNSAIEGYFAIGSSWNGFLAVISAANNSLKELEGFDSDASKKAIAEVRTLRAYAYFFMVRLWGPVPLVTSQTEEELKKGIAPSSIDEVYKFIEDELNAAIPDLTKEPPNLVLDRPGVITAYTAHTILGKAHLQQGENQKALDALKPVVEDGMFELEEDYYKLFKIAGKLSKESIFECQYSDFGEKDGDIFDAGNTFTFMNPGYSSTAKAMDNGWGFIEIEEKLLRHLIEQDDSIRYYTNVNPTPKGDTLLIDEYGGKESWRRGGKTPSGDVLEDNASTGNFFNGKAYTPSTELTTGRTRPGTNNNIRVLRYADVLLMYAEAIIQGATGGMKTADECINEVRARVELDPISGADLEDVLDERYSELSAEWGNRYFDLVRTGKASTELSGWSADYGVQFLPYATETVDSNPQLVR